MPSRKHRKEEEESGSESGSSSESSSGSSSASSRSSSPSPARSKSSKHKGHKHRKHKAKKDPNAPKGAKSPYIFYTEEFRAAVTTDLKTKMGSDFKITEVLKELGRRWKALSDEAKKPYVAKAEADKKRHEAEMEKYKPPQAAAAASSDSESGSDSGSERKHKKKRAKKDPNAPKRNRSPYIFYTEEHRAAVTTELKAKLGDEYKITEVMKELGKRWKALSEDARKPYNAKAAADKKRYEEETARYTGKSK